MLSLKDTLISAFAAEYSAEYPRPSLALVISSFIVPRSRATQVFLPAEPSYWLERPNMAEPDWLARVAVSLEFKDAQRGK